MTEGVLNLLGCSLLLCLVILFSFTLEREREKNFGYGLIVCSTRQRQAGENEEAARPRSWARLAAYPYLWERGRALWEKGECY
jgi:hypothetical protein